MSNAKLPSFKFLIGFEAAARLGNYSRAADELFVSQSAVSHQIAQLEAQVGQQLFRRKGRGVELTVAGRLLLESVTRSLEAIRSGLSRIETYLDENLVTLVCPAHVAHGWLQPRVDSLIADHPLLCPIVSVDETARYIDEMDVDIAITREPLKQVGVYEVPLLTDELVPVCSAELAAGLPARNPAQHHRRAGLLCLESDLTGERSAPFLKARFGSFRKVAIYDDPRLLLDAALRGRGIALLSRLMADSALEQGALVTLRGYPTLPAGTIWISRTEGEPRSPLVRGVFDSLLRYSQRK
jgi:LysR family transcriptional regulator, glycine cleavage system transcriptional activator